MCDRVVFYFMERFVFDSKEKGRLVHIVHDKNIVDILNNIKYKLFQNINESKTYKSGKAGRPVVFLSG